jgi:hypothetical protein
MIMTTNENTVKIEKGVPIAGPYSWSGNKKYPWEEMEVGDSFLFPEYLESPYTQAVSASKNGREFVVRSTREGFRCWRVA